MTTALLNHEINAEWLGIKYVSPSYLRLATLIAQNPIPLNLCVACPIGQAGRTFSEWDHCHISLTHTHCSFVTFITRKEQRDHHIWMNTMHHLQWAAACINPSGRNTKPNQAQHPPTSWKPPVPLELTEAAQGSGIVWRCITFLFLVLFSYLLSATVEYNVLSKSVHPLLRRIESFMYVPVFFWLLEPLEIVWILALGITSVLTTSRVLCKIITHLSKENARPNLHQSPPS